MFSRIKLQEWLSKLKKTDSALHHFFEQNYNQIMKKMNDENYAEYLEPAIMAAILSVSEQQMQDADKSSYYQAYTRLIDDLLEELLIEKPYFSELKKLNSTEYTRSINYLELIKKSKDNQDYINNIMEFIQHTGVINSLQSTDENFSTLTEKYIHCLSSQIELKQHNINESVQLSIAIEKEEFFPAILSELDQLIYQLHNYTHPIFDESGSAKLGIFHNANLTLEKNKLANLFIANLKELKTDLNPDVSSVHGFIIAVSVMLLDINDRHEKLLDRYKGQQSTFGSILEDGFKFVKKVDINAFIEAVELSKQAGITTSPRGKK